MNLNKYTVFFNINILILIGLISMGYLIRNHGIDNMVSKEFNYVKYQEKKVTRKKTSDKTVTTDSVVSKFVTSAVIESLSYDADKIPSQLKVAENFYTEKGWADFYASFEPRLQSLISEGDMISMSTILEEKPILMNTKKFAGIRVWKFFVKPTIRIVGKGGTNNDEYMGFIILSQKSDSKNIRGLAIDSFEIK